MYAENTWLFVIIAVQDIFNYEWATIALRTIVARCQTSRQRQTTEYVLPLTHIDLFRSLRMALMLIKTMQSCRANVICVRLHTHKLTQQLRTVSLPDNNRGVSLDLREQIAYMYLVCKQRDVRESLCVKANMPKAYLCLQSPHVAGSHHVALWPAAGVIDMGS